jgi:glucose/arabinose dehydrogenase
LPGSPTPPGVCVALVAAGFKFPRGILPLDNGDLLVVDMGGWAANRGVLWRLKRSAAGYERERVLDKLDRPHGLALGPDKRIYVGVAGRVLRFDPSNPKDTATDIVGGRSGVPALSTTGRHPLVNLVFGKDGNLFVSVGSASDNCEDAKHNPPDPDKPCAEAEGDAPRGAIRRYVMRWSEAAVSSWKTYASGLRNSMALAVHPESGLLLQGENSRDNIHRRMPGLETDEELPHDELNWIEEGARYGWPYCYDDGRACPEYPKADCSRYRAPLLLLPAHAAPLGMTYYFGGLLAEYRGALIVGYHGYRAKGHRIAAFETDSGGLLTGKVGGRGGLGRGGRAVDGRSHRPQGRRRRRNLRHGGPQRHRAAGRAPRITTQEELLRCSRFRGKLHSSPAHRAAWAGRWRSRWRAPALPS